MKTENTSEKTQQLQDSKDDLSLERSVLARGCKVRVRSSLRAGVPGSVEGSIIKA